jgi:hypothetical protein
MAIRKTIGFYYTNTPIEKQVFTGDNHLAVDKAIIEYVEANKDNIQGWNGPTRGIASELVEEV